MTPPTVPLPIRFWAKVGPPDANGCWPWLAAKARGGYGRIWTDRKPLLAYHYTWALVHGERPAGYEFHHSCENPSCVNPYHLQLVTRAEHRSQFHRTCDHDERYARADGSTCCRACEREQKRARYANDPVYREKSKQQARERQRRYSARKKEAAA